MTDAWVQLVRNGVAPVAGTDALVCPDGVPTNTSCEVVDKVLYVFTLRYIFWPVYSSLGLRYRGSKSVTLTATAFFYDTARFLSTDLATLTDHNPVRVEFKWAGANGFSQSDLYGGPHGFVDSFVLGTQTF